jgi:homoserine kinase
VEDKLHTPYRIENIPILKEISEILLDNNICYTLSGSGPTLLIYAEEQRAINFNEEFYKLVKSNLEKNKINYKFIPIETCETGTIIKN